MRTSSFRRTACLSAVALALPLLAVSTGPAASAGAPVPAAAPHAVAASPVVLRTSWPAVPVEQRLQPWLADVLPTASEPLRVMVSGETAATAEAAVAAAGLTAQQVWSKVGVVVAVGTPAQVRAVVGLPGVTYVEGDEPLEYTLDTAHEATRADEALAAYTDHAGNRIDGAGVTIAVIDSGIDGTHPMFTRDGESKVVRNLENVCTIASGPSDVCYVQEPTNDTDTNSAGGHGTHVAGIAAGYEVTTTAPAGVELRGSAPEAKLVGLSVGAAIGLVNANSAMNWVVEHQRRPCATAAEQEGDVDPACPPIRATNHSYGPIATEGEDQEYDPDSATVRLNEQLVALGVMPVWAAGNDGGDGSYAATNPAGMDPRPGVLMVASYNDGQNGNRDNQLSGFSSRGKASDPGTFPDLSAPGDLITSSCRPNLAICTGSPSYDAGNYQTISGTSMAAPYVAGVVALLAQSKPAGTPASFEDLLEDTAHEFAAGANYQSDPRNPDSETSFDKGHGLVDVLAVLAAQKGLPAPPEPELKCTATSFQVTDPEGDATQIVVVDTGANSQDDLDIVRAFLTWDETKRELTFHIQVKDLFAGGGDQYFRFYVVRESDPEVYAVANRDSLGESYSVKQYDAGTSTTVTGSFDDENDEVRIVLPADQYKEVIPGKTIAEGDTIGASQVLGQRDTGVVTATADTAAGSCPFVVGTSTPREAAEPVGPSPSPSASPSGSASPSPSASPSASPSPTASGSASPSPTPSGSASPSPTPSGSASPSPSPSPTASPSPSESPEPVQARSIDEACPEGKVPDSGRTDADGNTHERAIDCVIWWEISKGTSATQYDPEFEVSREQMASFIARFIEEAGGQLPADPKDHFTDDGGPEHNLNINKLAEVGIVQGRADGSYGPRESVNRGQMAKFLVNAYELVSGQELRASRDHFADDNDSPFEGFINRSAEVGFTNGRANGGYEPLDQVLRDQMASFLTRALSLLVEEGVTPPKQ